MSRRLHEDGEYHCNGGGEEEGGGCSGLNWWQPDQSLLGESAGSNENRLGSGKGREGGREVGSVE
jgi:hypothetical protein